MPLAWKRSQSLAAISVVRRSSRSPPGMVLPALIVIDHHLLEWRNVDPHRPSILAMHDLQRDLFADQPPQQHVEIGTYLAEIEHGVPHGPLRQKAIRRTRLAARLGHSCLIRMTCPGTTVGRLVASSRKLSRDHDGGQHVVEQPWPCCGQRRSAPLRVARPWSNSRCAASPACHGRSWSALGLDAVT